MIFTLTSHTIRYVSTENQQRIKPYDSIRAAFWEGKELYNTAGFKEKIIFRFAFAILNVLLDIFFQDSERGMNHTSSPEYVPVICLLGRS